MNTLAWKAADSETSSGTTTSTPTLTATETETETATAMMTATLAGTPTEAPPAPFESAYYTYDGDDNMVMSVINGVTTYYPDDNYVVEDNNSTITVTKTYFANTTAIAVRTIVDAENTLYWLLTDHLGSSSITTTADGTWNSEIRYTPYGETRYSSGITPTDFRYTGQLQQADINLYFYDARWYDPALGRFIQVDDVITSPSDSKAYDRYAYVNYNPIRYNDPSGHWVETALDIAFIAYDIYDIANNGLNWENGLSLAADVASAILPVVTGGGLAVKAAFHADDAVKAVKVADKAVDTAKFADAGRSISSSFTARKRGASELGTKALNEIRQPIANSILKKYVNISNNLLSADIRSAKQVLSNAEYGSAVSKRYLGNMQYGNALERLTALGVGDSKFAKNLFEHVGGPNKPDFVGKGIFNGLMFEITTTNKYTIDRHLKRWYVTEKNIIKYTRPKWIKFYW